MDELLDRSFIPKISSSKWLNQKSGCPSGGSSCITSTTIVSYLIKFHYLFQFFYKSFVSSFEFGPKYKTVGSKLNDETFVQNMKL